MRQQAGDAEPIGESAQHFYIGGQGAAGDEEEAVPIISAELQELHQLAVMFLLPEVADAIGDLENPVSEATSEEEDRLTLFANRLQDGTTPVAVIDLAAEVVHERALLQKQYRREIHDEQIADLEFRAWAVQRIDAQDVYTCTTLGMQTKNFCTQCAPDKPLVPQTVFTMYGFWRSVLGYEVAGTA